MALENQVTFAEVGNPKRVTQLTENTDAAGAYFLTEKVGETAAKKTSYATVESAVKSKVQSEYLQVLSATPASDKTMSEKLVAGELKKRDDKIVQLEQHINEILPKGNIYNEATNENGGINTDDGGDNDEKTQIRTGFIPIPTVDKVKISGTTRQLSTYFYDKNKVFIGAVLDVTVGMEFEVSIPSDAYYLRRFVKTSSSNDVNLLIVAEGSIIDTVKKLSKDDSNINLFNILEVENGSISADTGLDIIDDLARRTMYIPVTPSSELVIKNYNRNVNTMCYRKDKTFLKSFKDVDTITRFVLPTEAYYIRRVVKSGGFELDTYLSITQGDKIVFDLDAKEYPTMYTTVKPEDFDGVDISEKVKAANDYILKSKTACELLLKDTSLYVIKESIVLPENSKLTIDGCTLKLANGVFDNLIRTANILPRVDAPNEYVESLERVNCVKIVGLNGAKIEGADIPYRAANPKTGVVEDWIGDYWGWRAFLVLFSNVNTYDISGFNLSKNHSWCIVSTNGCCNGSIHDIVFNSTRANGDGVDFCNGINNVNVYNISGSTQDDTVGLFVFDNSRWRHDGYVYPLTPVPYEDYRYGDVVSNVTVSNIQASGTNHIFVILSNFATVKNIALSNIEDTLSSNKAAIVKIYGDEYGKNYKDGIITNITANNITNKNSPNTFYILGRPMSSWFNNIKTKTGKQVIYNPKNLDLSVVEISNSTSF